MKRLSILFFLLSLIFLFMLSCASNSTKNNGRVATDDDIRAMFKTYEYDLKYNYFYSLGKWSSVPEAIVGINKDYVLVKESYESDFTNWQQFEPGSEKLKELVDAMVKPTSNYYSEVGFKIYAPGGGDQIGIMYSVNRFGSNKPEIRFKDGNQIVVPSTFYPPGPGGAP
jgi:hypothetical protein